MQMIFTSFSKNSPTFVVRKYKPVDRSGNDNENKEKQQEVKVTLDEFDESEIDKIIAG